MSTTKKTVAKKAAKKTSTKKNTTKAITKKAAAKKSSKKTTTKKAATSAKKSADEKVLVCAPDNKCFWTSDGQILRDLRELEQALQDMSEDVFTHHVSKEKHDFADWVEHVLADNTCASALRRAKKPKSAHTVVIKQLRLYS